MATGQFDMGTAEGTVRIKYVSTGAKQVQKEIGDVQRAVAQGESKWVNAAAASGFKSTELQKYVELQKAAAQAAQVAASFEQNLWTARKRFASNSTQVRTAQQLSVQANASMMAVQKALATSANRVPADLASAGQVAANAYTDSFRRVGVSKASAAGGAITTALSAATKVGVTAVIAGIAAAAAGAGYVISRGFQRLEGIDEASAKLRGLGASGEQVDKIMSSALKAVKGTAFSLDQAATVAASAIAAGIKPGQQLTQYLKDTADAAAIAGTSLDEMGSIFNKIQAGGRLYSEDLMRLTDRGIPVFQWLAKEYGVTQGALRKMVESGQVDAEHFRKAIEDNIGGASLKMGTSSKGSVQNLQAAIGRLGQAMIGPAFGSLPNIITGITNSVDKLGGWFSANQEKVVHFWADFAKVAITAGQAIGNVIAFLLKGFGEMYQVIGTVYEEVGKFSDFLQDVPDVLLGPWGVAIKHGGKQLSDFGKSLKSGGKEAANWGDTLNRWVNDEMPKWWGKVDEWDKHWTKAGESGASAGHQLATGMDSAGAAVDDFSAQAQKLNITMATVDKAVTGTNESFKEFLDSLKEKNASAGFINQVIAMRNAFDQAGPGAVNLSKALDQLGDKSVSASDKSQALIKALQQLGILPGEASASVDKLNKALDEVTKLDTGNDPLGRFGTSLINVNGEIDTATKNGDNLKNKFTEIQQAMFEAAAAGADPNAVWQKAHDGLILAANDARIFGDDAENLVQKYLLSPHQFQILFLARNNDAVRNDLINLFSQVEDAKKKGDNKVEFSIGVTGDKDQLQKAIENLGGSVVFDATGKMATVKLPTGAELDKQIAALEAQWATQTDPMKLPSLPDLAPDAQTKVQDEVSGWTPIKVPAQIDVQTPNVLSPKPKGGWFTTGDGVIIPGGSNLPAPATAGANPNTPPAWPPMDTGGPLPGGAGQGYFDSRAAAAALDQVTAQTGDQAATQAHDQGANFAQSFAKGILDNLQAVSDAVLQMAQLAGDPLGHSPAPYGPLSGAGWTYERGKRFTLAFAQGITNNLGAVGNASLDVAGNATSPMSQAFTGWLKDMQDFSGLGRHLLDFVSSLADIAFGAMTVAQNLSGGTLFPKTYVADKAAADLATRRQNRALQLGAIQSGNVLGAPQLPAAGDKAGVAKYIYQSALARGYTPQQAKAILAYGIGESGLNPGISGGRQGGNSPADEVLGIFQEKAGFAQAGGIDPNARGTLQGNVTAYLNQLEKNRQMPIEQALPATSVGGPLSDVGRQPWQPLLDQAQGYIDSFGQQTTNTVVSQAVQNAINGAASILHDSNGLTSGPLARQAAAVVQQMFPQITDIGGARASGVPGTHNAGRAIDIAIPGWDTAQGKMLGSQINQYLQQNAGALGINYTIWDAMFNPAGGQSKPYSYQGPDPSQAHRNHIDVQFNASNKGDGTAVTLDPLSQNALRNIDSNTGNTVLGLNDTLSQLSQQDGLFNQAVQAARGQTSLTANETNPLLQHLDSLIAEQTRLGTPDGKATADQLGGIRTQLMDMQGVTEGPNALATAQTITSGVTGLAGDVLEVVDATLKSIGSAKEISGVMARGVANTEDIYNMVENFQSFIELGQKVAGLTADALGFASSLVGAAGAGDTSGGTQAAAMALGAASGVAQIVSQVYAAVNAGIDIGQEVYRISTKYLGRALQQWFGFSGATDIKYLLDTQAGQLQVYSSDNPLDKHYFNTLGRELGMGNYSNGSTAYNNWTIYQGPGQDPRDTMSNAMFQVKSSNVGVFGYGGDL